MLPGGLLSSLLLSALVSLSYGLMCYQDVQLLPANDSVAYSNNKTTARHKFEVCVIIRKHNGTHQLARRDAFGFEKLPLECRAFGEHCFSKKNEKKQWTTVYGCCCSSYLCNEKDDAIDMFRPEAINPSFPNHLLHWLRAILCWFAMITVPIWLTILGTVVYCRIMKALNKEMVYEWDEEIQERKFLLETGRTIEESQKSQNEALRKTVSESKVNDPKLATATSEVSVKKRKKDLDVTQKSDSDVDVTQKSDSRRLLVRSPIRGIQQERPKSKILLPNGRVQKVSMNFEEDDWDD